MKDEVPYDQPTVTPTPKVASAGLAGALTILIVFVAKSGFDFDIPAEVASAFTALVAFGAAYFKRDAKPAAAIPIIKGQI